MASMASLLNLGGVDAISIGNFDGSVCWVRTVSFRRSWNSCSRFKYACVCKYSVPTDFTTEPGNSVARNSTLRGRSNSNDDAHRGVDYRPVLKSEPEVDPRVSVSWQESKLRRNSGNEESSKVSLGEVLENVEKLGTSTKESISVNKSPYVRNPKYKVKTMKSIWRRGSSAATVQKVVTVRTKQESHTDGEGAAGSHSVGPPKPYQPPVNVQPKLQVKREFGADGREAASSQSVAPPRPYQKPQNIQRKLQVKPSVGPPLSIEEPVILKEVSGDAKKSDDNETDFSAAIKARRPILVDKFAFKKPVVDPRVAKHVAAPKKPRKSLASGKFKAEYRKKSILSEGPRRRLADKDDKIPDEDTNELDVPIPGAATAQIGRKWTKARRKAARLQVARDAAPIRVEILEVGEDGMLTEELAFNLAISEGEILGYLYSKGIRPDGVLKLSNDMVKMVCKEYGVEVIDAIPTKVEEMAKKKGILDDGDLDQLEARPPVITIMGHVDHGKTTLLDYIRKSKVAAGEAGGITQGIGAYMVPVPVDGKTQTCVFFDTPGHEAFGAMRARGARVTDIAVVVVAADDGIQPQTNEAIAHAKAAQVPIIVAINKIDKNGANPDRVKQELSSIGLMPEDWGGDIPIVKISALKGENVDELLETIMLVAELQELKANPHRHAKGTVIEAGLDKAKGPVATFIVQNGTLKRGNVIVCGGAFGKVRALFDDSGKRVDEAGPSIPVQVLGLSNVPLAGDDFEVVNSLAIAREKAEAQSEYLRNEHIMEKAGDGKVTLASLASAVSSANKDGLDLHQLNIILKVDVQGSIEAIRQALQMLPHDNVSLKFLLQATGDVSTGDVDLAVASKAIIFGFNIRAPGSIKSSADNKKVEIRLYKVIYELVDDVRKAMEGLLNLVEERVRIGLAEVRAVFISGSGRAAGCMVTEGKVVKECGIRVLRKGKEVHVGILGSLRRVKEMVKEVNVGLECGIGVEGFNDWEAGDMIEAFNTMQKRRTLEEASATMSAALKEVGIKM